MHTWQTVLTRWGTEPSTNTSNNPKTKYKSYTYWNTMNGVWIATKSRVTSVLINAKALYGTIAWKLIPLAMNMNVVNLRMRSHNLRFFWTLNQKGNLQQPQNLQVDHKLKLLTSASQILSLIPLLHSGQKIWWRWDKRNEQENAWAPGFSRLSEPT